MADNTKISQPAQRSDFENELRRYVDDDAVLDEIQAAVKAMLSGDSVRENDLRATLQQRCVRGELSDAALRQVLSLIDRIVSHASSSEPADCWQPGDEAEFSSTTVIPDQADHKSTIERQLQIGSVLRDRFMLAEKVSGGSMGTVFKALDRRLAEADSENHWVAIKVLAPQLSQNADALRALQQEAVKTRCLSHPNIVKFIDLDRDDEQYFMVMEWLDGRSLAEILDDSTSRDMQMHHALDIIRQIAAALHHAHQRGVVHADIKPGNIMVLPSGQVKLCDFGVARIRQKQRGALADFDPGVLKAASPAYSSMQVLTGEEPAIADDVFSLACLAYRLLAGYRAFGPRNAAEAAEAGMEPQRIESLGKAQWKALRKALAFSRVARFATPGEFVEALTVTKERRVAGKMFAVPDIAIDDIRVDELDAGSRSSGRFFYVAVVAAVAAGFIYQQELLQLFQQIGKRPEQTLSVELPLPAEASSNLLGEALPVEESVPDAETPEEFSQELLPESSRSAVSELAIDGAGKSLVAERLPEVNQEVLAKVVLPAIDVEPDASLSLDRLPNFQQAVEDAKPIVDFSTLPPANMIVPLAGPGEIPGLSSLILREDTAPIIVDFVRATQLREMLTVRITEASHDGNLSPMERGQYRISNNGLIVFPQGQHRSRVSIAMESDPLREPDRQVILKVLDVAAGDIEYASIHLTLQDDDQRLFEASVAANTIAFAVSQVSTRERDPVVQIDLVRFNPDASSMQATFEIRDVTATEGADYIAPASNTISFAPHQRSARILIPLVQDTAPEADEAFMLELLEPAPDPEGNTYRRIAVMIRDDD